MKKNYKIKCYLNLQNQKLLNSWFQAHVFSSSKLTLNQTQIEFNCAGKILFQKMYFLLLLLIIRFDLINGSLNLTCSITLGEYDGPSWMWRQFQGMHSWFLIAGQSFRGCSVQWFTLSATVSCMNQITIHMGM